MADNVLVDKDVLVLNWRDITHPHAGGAEVYCWELAWRLAKMGGRVTLFTERHVGAIADEVRNGVQVIRRGNRLTVYLAAAAHMLWNRRRYSAVVDIQNGIPFFAPLFVHRRSAVVCVLHHVHQHQFQLYFSPPIAWLGRVLEKHVSRVVYGRRPLVAVSPSTRRDMRLVLGLKGPIHVVPNGAERLTMVEAPRSQYARIAVVTRLVPQKRLPLLLKAVKRLHEDWNGLHVDIAGTGQEADALETLVEQLELSATVTLHGWVDGQRKAELLTGAWLTVIPSLSEGWGLTVIEANSAGTPALAFDVPGLRDSIRPGVTGWLLPEGADLAVGLNAALTELADPAVRRKYADACQKWAEGFDWDRSAERLAHIIAGEMGHVQNPRVDSRSRSDLATVVDGRLRHSSCRELLRSVRRTDTVSVDGQNVRLILDGCDDIQARRVVERLDVVPVRLRLTSSTELLVR